MNRKYVNVLLLSVMIIYILIYRLFIYTNLLSYAESITASFSLVISAVSVYLLGYRKSNRKNIGNKLFKNLIVYLLFYFLLIYGMGISTGYLANSYSLSFKNIINNTFFIFLIIIFIELFRYIFLSANKDNKKSIIFMTIVIILFEINLFIKKDTFSNVQSIFDFLTVMMLPIIMKNILCSYLTYHYDYKNSIIYRLVMDLYIYIVPLEPDLGDFVNSVFNILLPFLIVLSSSRIIYNYENRTDKGFNKKYVRISDIPFIIFFVIMIFLVLGIGPYKIIGIKSGSMSPAINIGDAVIINRNYNVDKLKEKDVVAFLNQDNDLVIHRIDKINMDGTFITKGDYNNTPDIKYLKKEKIKGKVVFRIPFIAYPALLFN